MEAWTYSARLEASAGPLGTRPNFERLLQQTGSGVFETEAGEMDRRHLDLRRLHRRPAVCCWVSLLTSLSLDGAKVKRFKESDGRLSLLIRLGKGVACFGA